MTRANLPFLTLLITLAAGCPPGGGATTADAPSSTAESTEGSGSTASATQPTSGDDTTGTTASTGATITETTGDASTTGGTAGTTGGSTGAVSTDTSGASTGGSSTGGSTGTSDGSTSGTSGGDTEGDTEGQPLCSSVLLQSHEEDVTVHRSGAAIATLDSKKNLVLWDEASLAAVRAEIAVDKVALVGERMVFQRAAQLHVVDATNGATIGVCPADAQWGLAGDAGYLWTSGQGGVQVRELDCTPRWSAAGTLADAKVLATAAALHVWDADLGVQTATRFAAVDGATSTIMFAGSFAQWFADVPRFWTVQGDSFRLFDSDGALLEFALGTPVYGWGSRFVLGKTVRDVAAPKVTLATFTGTPKYSNGAIFAYDHNNNKTSRLVRLDVDPVTVAQVGPVCCVEFAAFWSFAYGGDGEWAVGGRDGLSADHLGRLISPGTIVGLAGSQSGRAAVGVHSAKTFVFDVADDCSPLAHPPFSRNGTEIWMSGDGSLLLSREGWQEMFQSLKRGTRFYSLPGGQQLAGIQLGIMSDDIVDHDVSDDGSVWSRTWTNTGVYWNMVADFPGLMTWQNNNGDVVPKIAPNAGHVVVSDGIETPFDDWTDSQSYVHAPKDFVAVFPGVAHGFIDDQHVLVGHYQGEAFVGAEIVDVAGMVVQDTPLPDIHRFLRLGTGEILGYVEPTGDAAVFDPFTGQKLWDGPPGAKVVVAGQDFVVIAHHGRVELVRWR